MLNVAIAGLGVHGMRYVKHVAQDVAEMNLVAVCRRDAEEAVRVAHDYGARWFSDVEAMLDETELDALIVVTPPPSHLAIARAALRRGVAVVLEKPLTQTLEEAHQLQQIVRDTGCPLFLTQSLRYNQALRLAREELPRIGTVHSLTAAQRLPRTDLLWQNSKAVHPLGSILNTGVHLYDLVRWMLGAEFDSVFCQAQRIQNPFHEDLFKMQARLEDRATLVALEVAKCTNSRSSNLTLVGQHGQLWVDYQTDEVILVQDTERQVLKEASPAYTIPALLKDFAQAFQNRLPMPIDVVDGVRSMEVVEAAYRSIADDGPVKVKPQH